MKIKSQADGPERGVAQDHSVIRQASLNSLENDIGELFLAELRSRRARFQELMRLLKEAGDAPRPGRRPRRGSSRVSPAASHRTGGYSPRDC